MDLNFRIPGPSPLEVIVRDIRRAFDAQLFYVAIQLSLSLPDICSSLEKSRNSNKPWKGVQDRYEEWCQTYLEPQYQHFNAQDCWALRGGVIHNAMLSGHPRSRHTRVIFTLPAHVTIAEGLVRNPGGLNETALTLDAKTFCERMITAVQTWHAAKKDDDVVAENSAGLVRLRPQGMAPYFIGVPVIA